MKANISLLAVALLAALALPSRGHAAPGEYFTIEVVDEQTGRGVPLVELKTTSYITHVTDSNGIVAFLEPGLMNQKVWFTVSSHGYEHAADGFGSRGVTLEVKPGGSAKIKIKRINIAERLYRSTGQGIYRDSVLVGRKTPLRNPVLNGKVFGQDSVLATPYRGKIYWFWGDTNRPWYPLGLFRTSGATSEPPGKGGLKPDVGINFTYFVDAEGFSRAMAPHPEQKEGPIWIDGVLTLKDEKGRERLLCHFSRMKSLGERLERGLMLYNDEKEIFEKTTPVPLDAPLAPAGHPLRATVDGQEYFYFPDPYPATRVKADWVSFHNLSEYEGYTCLAPGAQFDGANTKIQRDAGGKLVFAWKKGTPPLSPAQQKELVSAGKMTRDESPFRLTNIDDGQPVQLHGGSIYWNDYRKKFVMIGLETFGKPSFLGEIWFAESEKPEGPWTKGKRIVTHNKMDFYNPTQHPFFDEQGGKIIYFEGTYTNSFSGNPVQTPRYEYNQVMYRLDLSDPRLKLP